jgi:hypothetical protein
VLAELVLLVVLVALVLLAICRAPRGAPDDPLVIRHPGKYHITLAPQLARAQAFIENIVGCFSESGCQAGDIPTQYFEVCDAGSPSQGQYLLAVAVRGGTLYFQAINPPPLLRDADSPLKTLREFSEAVLQQLPLSEHADGQCGGQLSAAIDAAAGRSHLVVKVLQSAG